MGMRSHISQAEGHTEKASRQTKNWKGSESLKLVLSSDLPVDDLLTVEETLVTLQAAQPDDPDLALSMCQGLHNLLKSGTLHSPQAAFCCWQNWRYS